MPSAASVAQRCSITFSCVFNDEALSQVFSEYLSGEPSKGSVFADCSTVYPDTIRELDSKAKAAGDQAICSLLTRESLRTR